MVWNAGLQMWQAFAGSFDIPQQNPMDTWTRRVVDPIASAFKAQALFPFDSPPYHPFQQWAQRTEPILPSPIGALIHLMHGLWHAYRAEFIFDHRVDMSTIKKALSPCKSCVDKPCLTACSVGAFKPDHYNVPACVDHLNTMAPMECGLRGCLARHACPVGKDYVYEPKHAQFHVEKFVFSQQKSWF